MKKYGCNSNVVARPMKHRFVKPTVESTYTCQNVTSQQVNTPSPVGCNPSPPDPPKPPEMHGIVNNNNPIININNNVNCSGHSCDHPCECNPESAALMGSTLGKLECVGDDFQEVGKLEFTLVSNDPMVVTATPNWVYKPYNGYPGCGCGPDDDMVIAEFVATREITDGLGNMVKPEEEVARTIDSAPGKEKPVATMMQFIDKDIEEKEGKMIYRFYARATKAYIESIAPFNIMARQYPEKA